jgi:hypothetical protein
VTLQADGSFTYKPKRNFGSAEPEKHRLLLTHLPRGSLLGNPYSPNYAEYVFSETSLQVA